VRRTISFSTAFLLSGLFLLAAAEVCLRFLPVSTGFGPQAVNADNPVPRYEPNSPFTYSEGWSLANANMGWVNNDGFVNDQDYDPADPRPLLAIIGDCFIEAKMVPSGDTLQGRLAAAVGAKGRVYSFAIADSGLSQYLMWASYAAAKYKPDAVAINIAVHNFEESLTKYGVLPGRYQFSEAPDGRLELNRNDFARGLRSIKQHSALVQYLVPNLREFRDRVFRKRVGCPPNSCASPDAQRLADSQKVLTVFLDELSKRASLPPERILLIVDSIRPEVYTDETAGKDSYFGIIRQRLLEQASQRGYETIDLNPLFAAAYRQDKRLLDLGGYWSHWNSAGHALVSDAVRHSKVFSKVFTRPKVSLSSVK
jgi:hypothetical protein